MDKKGFTLICNKCGTSLLLTDHIIYDRKILEINAGETMFREMQIDLKCRGCENKTDFTV